MRRRKASYARAIPSASGLGGTLLWLIVAAMAAIETYGAFGQQPASEPDEAHTAIIAYLALATLAGTVNWSGGRARTEQLRHDQPHAQAGAGSALTICD